MKVFLGGTCNESTWRDILIPLLKIDFFNPVVEDWTEEDQIKEKKERSECDVILYTLTPQLTGVYSVAEVVEDSIMRPERTILCILEECDGESFDKGQLKSLNEVSEMVSKYGVITTRSLEETAKVINGRSIGMSTNPWGKFWLNDDITN